MSDFFPIFLGCSPILKNGNTSTIPFQMQPSWDMIILTSFSSITGFTYYGAMQDWSPIPATKRDSRAVIKAVGDSYLDRFDNASVIVPWGAPCNRLEGGALVVENLTGDDCVMAFPDDIKVINRRYVVDEVLGAVDIFEGFPGLD